MLISSSSNKLVKEIVEFKRKGKKSKSPLLYFEGLRLVKDILNTDAVVESLIIRESDVERYKYFSEKYPVIIFADKIFNEISGTVNSQGIAVLAHRPILSADNPGDLALVLDRVQDPGNLGTIIRTALAAGVNSIYLLKGTVDLFNEKTLRSTMGALYKVPILYDIELDEIIALTERFNMTAVKASAQGEYVYNELPKGKYMLFMGNEGNGISQEVDKLPGIGVKIPLYGDIESLNVAVATGIILYGIKSVGV